MGGILWFLSSFHDDDDDVVVVDDDDNDDAFRLRNAPSSRTFLVNIAAVASSFGLPTSWPSLLQNGDEMMIFCFDLRWLPFVVVVVVVVVVAGP
jgi:hypothetical protein